MNEQRYNDQIQITCKVRIQAYALTLPSCEQVAKVKSSKGLNPKSVTFSEKKTIVILN